MWKIISFVSHDSYMFIVRSNYCTIIHGRNKQAQCTQYRTKIYPTTIHGEGKPRQAAEPKTDTAAE